MVLLLAVVFLAVHRDPSQLLLQVGAWAHLADLAR